MNRNRVNKKRMGRARVLSQAAAGMLAAALCFSADRRRWQDRREILLLHRHPRMWDRAEARAVPIQEVQAALAVQIQFPMEV